MKPIRLSSHAWGNLPYRGATGQEVVEAIRSSTWEKASEGALSVEKIFLTDNIGTANFTLPSRSGQSLSRELMRLW